MRIADRLPESLPAHHALQDARNDKGRGRGDSLTIWKSLQAGLICLTGGEEGPLAAALARGGENEARKIAERLAAIYGRGNLYLELQRHQEREEECRNQSLLSVAASLGLPVIATNGVRYATDKRSRDAGCVHQHSPSHDAGQGGTAAGA